MARLVICDDETGITDVLCRFFREKGHEAIGVSRPEEALERVFAGGCDLVITDVAMEGLSGLDLLERLKAAGSEIPVILTTGNPSHDGAVQALRGGAFDYLVKPFHLEEIAERAARALSMSRMREEHRLYSKLVSLQSISKTVAAAASPEELAGTVIRLGTWLTGSDGGWFRAAGKQGPAGLRPDPEEPGFRACLSGLADAAESGGDPHVSDPSGGGEAWYLSVPLTAGKTRCGALIFRRWKSDGKFDGVDLEVAGHLGIITALGIKALGAMAAKPAEIKSTKSA